MSPFFPKVVKYSSFGNNLCYYDITILKIRQLYFFPKVVKNTSFGNNVKISVYSVTLTNNSICQPSK